MDTGLLNSLAYGTVACLSSIVGLYILLINEKWAVKNSMMFIGFAAGVMLSVAFINILPEAFKSNGSALTVVLITLLSFYVLERILMIHSCPEDRCSVHPMGWVSIMGIGLHSIMDGISIGVGFEADYKIGLAATIGVFLHKLPAGMNITAILLHAGYGRQMIVGMSLLIAMATPLGALLAHLLFSNVSRWTIGFLLAMSAGSFIYIGAADLLPETHRDSRRINIVFVILGSIMIYTLAAVFGRD